MTVNEAKEAFINETHEGINALIKVARNYEYLFDGGGVYWIHHTSCFPVFDFKEIRFLLVPRYDKTKPEITIETNHDHRIKYSLSSYNGLASGYNDAYNLIQDIIDKKLLEGLPIVKE